MSELKHKVETRLQNLIVNKDQELVNLCTDLGYEYDNEIVDSLFSDWTENQSSLVNQITRLGYHGEFSIFWVRLSNDSLNKTHQRTVINLINRRFPYNLCIFSNLKDSVWDFVNIKAVKNKESDEDKEPKKRQFIRRIRIDQQERLRTAVERITHLKVPEDGAHHFELQKQHDEAFDVEKVTDAFFDDFEKVFTGFKNHLFELTEKDELAHSYGLQFFNRLIFVYFIQKKRWLGDDPEFVKSYWETYLKSEQQENSFVDKWLGILFFEAFNNKFSHPRWLPKKLQSTLQLAPYLNGGLFKKTDLDNHHSVQIHDSEFKNIFDFLQSYNFTITEDSPIDQEVAVDPEMIGKIYETMTFVEGDIEKAHSHGIVYTPRTEITLMCRLALVDRLTNEFGSEHKNLFYELLFAFTEEDKVEADQRITDQNLWPGIGIFLDQITILDPAVGSGSFLVGMLNILADLKMRANSQQGVQETPFQVKKKILGRSLYGVDIMEWAVHVCELRLWLQLVVETPFESKSEINFLPLLPNLDLNIRTGDSLVQMVGDVNFSHLHLTDLPQATKGRLTTLKGEKRKYFYNDPKRKYKTRRQVDQAELNIFREILVKQIHEHNQKLKRIERIIEGTDVEQKGIFGDEPKQNSINMKKGYAKEQRKLEEELEQFNIARQALKDRGNIPFVWDISFAEIFSEDKHGFDIVIGNPPYVRQELIANPKENPEDFGGETSPNWKTAKKVYKQKLMQSLNAEYPDFFHFDKKKQKYLRKLDAKNDLYVYFYLHGMSLLNTKGSFCFVTSNSWLDVGYGKDLQEFLLKKAPIKLIMDNQVKRSFKSADVNTVICLFGAPSTLVIARSEATKQSPKFVMFYVPFEECLDPILFEEIDEANDRKTTPEFRVVPKDANELLTAGTDESKKDSLVAYTGDKWGGKYLRAPDIYFTILEKGKDKLVRLGDIAEVRRGFTTGANEFFYLTQEKIDEWGIEAEFLKPVIKSPRECKTIQINPDDLKYKIFMCHKSK
ncbi:MAG: type IIS restriction/modification enzyme - site-specific DNA methyltransferase (adenine specific), partial [Candidatus Scalindua rubra]